MTMPQVTTRGRFAAACLALLLAGVLSAAFGWVCDRTFGHERWTAFVLEYFALVLGLPMAAALAFGIVVAFYLAVDQPVAIKLGPFEMTGPATPIVLWIACFLATVGAIVLVAGVRTGPPV
jgi:predicted outer membrane lipoprotein